MNVSTSRPGGVSVKRVIGWLFVGTVATLAVGLVMTARFGGKGLAVRAIGDPATTDFVARWLIPPVIVRKLTPSDLAPTTARALFASRYLVLNAPNKTLVPLTRLRSPYPAFLAVAERHDDEAFRNATLVTSTSDVNADGSIRYVTTTAPSALKIVAFNRPTLLLAGDMPDTAGADAAPADGILELNTTVRPSPNGALYFVCQENLGANTVFLLDNALMPLTMFYDRPLLTVPPDLRREPVGSQFRNADGELIGVLAINDNGEKKIFTIVALRELGESFPAAPPTFVKARERSVAPTPPPTPHAERTPAAAPAQIVADAALMIGDRPALFKKHGASLWLFDAVTGELAKTVDFQERGVLDIKSSEKNGRAWVMLEGENRFFVYDRDTFEIVAEPFMSSPGTVAFLPLAAPDEIIYSGPYETVLHKKTAKNGAVLYRDFFIADRPKIRAFAATSDFKTIFGLIDAAAGVPTALVIDNAFDMPVELARVALTECRVDKTSPNMFVSDDDRFFVVGNQLYTVKDLTRPLETLPAKLGPIVAVLDDGRFLLTPRYAYDRAERREKPLDRNPGDVFHLDPVKKKIYLWNPDEKRVHIRSYALKGDSHERR